MKLLISIFPIFLFLSIQVLGQNLNGERNELTPFLEALEQFSENISQEKAYLHFDNTSYYQGDNIWFKAYVVTSGRHELSQLSKTLYVELLNPGGEIVDTRILKIEDGQCHGEFMLSHLPFYSGFYEIRAYTKYMLNFGDDVIFSRLLPVFDKPKVEGNYEEKEMMKYGRYGSIGGKYPMNRKSPERGKAVNLHFFPEGGNCVQGVASQIAFEAVDEAGNPIDVSGVVLNSAKQELCMITTRHEGKGVFTYTPTGDSKRKDVAEVEYSGKKYRFDLPTGLQQGVVMETDNLSYPDSIEIILRRNSATPAEILGVAVLSEGKLQAAYFAHTENITTTFKTDKTELPSGVTQIVLFNNKGDVLCDRLVFVNNDDNFLEIKAETNKTSYRPYELAEMEFSVTDSESNPVNTTFSLSVRDGAGEVESNHNILTDLLLMSEIRGYVRNPPWYLESNDETHRASLDVLLMVQGWRRYSWKQMVGVEPFELKHFAEQGIETNGKIVSLTRQRPRPNVDVTLFMSQHEEENEEGGYGFIESFVTDSLGRFSFVSDVLGKWNLTLTATENGKKRDHLILLDRLFSPEPKRYRYADLQVNLSENNNEDLIEDEISDYETDESLDSLLMNYSDSLSKLGITDKVHILDEVVVKAKRNSRAQDIFAIRQNSSAYYDVASEIDDIYDSGKYIGDDIHDLLKNMNKEFYSHYSHGYEVIRYKGKLALIVIDYEPVEWTSYEKMFRYKTISLPAIKSIAINEKLSFIAQYVRHPGISSATLAEIFGCVVFIETYPDGQVPTGNTKGIRKTRLNGYNEVKEFYHPNYLSLPPDPYDYRRTLYWNPSVTTDENGIAKIKLYNNNRSTNFRISAETITPHGMVGIYKNK